VQATKRYGISKKAACWQRYARLAGGSGIKHHQQEAWRTLFLMLAGFDFLCPAPFLASTRSIISSVALCAAAFFSARSAGESLGSRKSGVFCPERLEVLGRHLLGCMRLVRLEPAHRQMYQGAIQLKFLDCKMLAIIRVSVYISLEITAFPRQEPLAAGHVHSDLKA
jgi:hypothetical protein